MKSSIIQFALDHSHIIIRDFYENTMRTNLYVLLLKVLVLFLKIFLSTWEVGLFMMQGTYSGYTPYLVYTLEHSGHCFAIFSNGFILNFVNDF